MMGILWSVFVNFVGIVHMLVDRLVEMVLERVLPPKQVCPAIVSSDPTIITKSATDLARMIFEKRAKSYAVVKAYIDRINEVNGVLNAVIDGPFSEALDEAREIDRKIENGEISDAEFSSKPFLGVPFTTKDSTAVKGKLHTLGLVSRRNTRADEDAECVRLMKEAGAIIIATTSVPEVNKWIETRNLVIGNTNNPYDTRRSVGGSSGGEGALVAACGTAIGLGTDIGGSIRIPAFNCGIFGHKATTGTINMRGCTFRRGDEEETMVTAGPMTRNATDLLPIFKVLVGPKNAELLTLNEKVDVKKLKYYYIPQNNVLISSPVSNEMKATMEKTISHLSSISGQNVQQVQLSGLEYSGKLWMYWMTQEPAEFSKLIGNGVKPNPFIELAKKLFNKSQFTLAGIYGMINDFLPVGKPEKWKEITRQMEEELDSILEDDGVLIFPSSPKTTPFHYYPLVKFGDFHYFSIFNVLKVPATQVPMGLSADGLPLGIQVISKRNNDRYCLAVAEELERAFGGWVPPFPTK